MADYDDFEVDDTLVQRVLTPVLSYLSTILPPPIFSIVSPLITYSLALLGALLRFARTLASAQNWDSQKILPPLITLLMAYLALVSFYRTTGWMIRTTFWFVKWGGILAALAAGAGYFMGTAQGDPDGIAMFNNGGVLGMLGNLLLGVLNEDATGNKGRARSPRSSKSKTKKQKERPKAWEGWDKHRDWQYNADAAARDDAARANENVQEAVQKVAGFVQEALGTGWWETVKNAVEGSGLVGTSGEQRKEGTRAKGKTKQDTKGRGSSR